MRLAETERLEPPRGLAGKPQAVFTFFVSFEKRAGEAAGGPRTEDGSAVHGGGGTDTAVGSGALLPTRAEGFQLNARNRLGQARAGSRGNPAGRGGPGSSGAMRGGPRLEEAVNATHRELEAGLHGAGDGLLLVAGALDLGALAGASETLSTLACGRGGPASAAAVAQFQARPFKGGLCDASAGQGACGGAGKGGGGSGAHQTLYLWRRGGAVRDRMPAARALAQLELKLPPAKFSTQSPGSRPTQSPRPTLPAAPPQAQGVAHRERAASGLRAERRRADRAGQRPPQPH